MKLKVKTAGFSESSILELSHNINTFLEEKGNQIEVVDIKYDALMVGTKDRRHYALIIFKTE